MENPESSLYKNFLMFDKIMEYERFMENKKYPEAIIAAEQSIIYGKEWKGYDTLYYEDFSGTFEKLADAYVKNGDSLYTKRDYNTALINYLQADSILTHKEHIPKYPKATESDIYWNRYNLLLTYNKLSDNKNYDLEVDYLANNYSKVKDTVDLDYYYIMKNVGNNYYERSWFSESILINKSSLKVLSRDSLNNIDEYRNTYIQLIKNYLTTDSLNNTRKYLNEFKKIALIDDCLYLFYNTSLLQRENIKEALGSAKKTLECFEQGNNYNNIFEANLILAIIELENSNYSNFEDQIINAHKLVYKTTNRDYKQAKLDQVSAYYNQILGNYKESKSSYYKALDYYKNSDDPNQLAIELKIAQINDDLNINYNKENINEQALNFLSEYEIVLPSFTSIYNDLGNINIGFDLKLSDSLFNVTISSHNDYGIEYTSALGVAYNGLGANKLDQKDYKKADSLFNIALIQLDKFYEKNQNFNQIINQLNLAESKFHQKDFLSSKYYLNEAILTKNNCFKNKVTIYDAYILNLEGDILKNSLHNSEESLQKYILALDIAKKHFDENHRFIINLQRKLKL
jgi:hypothetical protein